MQDARRTLFPAGSWRRGKHELAATYLVLLCVHSFSELPKHCWGSVRVRARVCAHVRQT